MIQRLLDHQPNKGEFLRGANQGKGKAVEPQQREHSVSKANLIGNRLILRHLRRLEQPTEAMKSTGH